MVLAYAAELQPLLPTQQGSYPPPLKKPRGYLIKDEDLSNIAGLPWLTFTVSALAVGMIPQGIRIVTYIVGGLGFVNSVIYIGLGFSQGQAKDRRSAMGSFSVGLLCMASLGAGWMVGLLADYSYMDEYWRLARGSTHQNVMASGLGAVTYSDASVLEFRSGTFIDTERSLGYMEHGQVYCVAPVTGQAFSSSPLYYAVGLNCCDQRSNFRCSKAEPGAGKVLTAVVLSKGESDPYQTAIRMLGSVYNLQEKEGDARISLKFLSDVDDHVGDLWHGAFISIICASMCHGFICVILVVFLRNRLKDRPPSSSEF